MVEDCLYLTTASTILTSSYFIFFVIVGLIVI